VISSLDKYTDGLSMLEFKHLPDISVYNHNFYIGLDKDLLFALSDDDNTTEWFLVLGLNHHFIGNSYTDEGDKLEKLNERYT